MTLHLSEQEDIYVIKPEGPALALESHIEIRDIFKRLKDKSPSGVVLDLSNVDRVDSLGLGSLISGRLSLRGLCEIQLCCLSHQVEALIRHSRMDLLFPIHESLSEALEASKKSKEAKNP